MCDVAILKVGIVFNIEKITRNYLSYTCARFFKQYNSAALFAIFAAARIPLLPTLQVGLQFLSGIYTQNILIAFEYRQSEYRSVGEP